MDRAEKLANAGADILTLDVAHAHMERALEITRELKQRFGSHVDIISGVVGTYEGAHDLFKAGADSVRVGVGPGTICITRIVTGVGVPQITAVMEASRAARKFKRTILCDGGIKNSGDIVKALAAGASAAIAGSLFAGTDEAPGEKIEKDGKTYKVYNASTSLTEKKNHIKKIGNELSHNYSKQVEGVESLVPFKGPVAEVIENLTSGIRSGLSYCGAANIETLWKKAKFIQVTASGVRESGAHDVILTKSPYN
jgi:IMP dehydrogenase